MRKVWCAEGGVGVAISPGAIVLSRSHLDKARVASAQGQDCDRKGGKKHALVAGNEEKHRLGAKLFWKVNESKYQTLEINTKMQKCK